MLERIQAIELLAGMTSDNDPGIQYVVVDRDRLVHAHSAGLADVAGKVPLSLEHTLSAFSMTKTLTALAILQLAEQSRLDLDDRVSPLIKHPYNQDISIRQLMNHTSGIPNPIPLKWVHLAEHHQGFNERAALDAVLENNAHQIARPGERYCYSNINYWLLGSIIESVTHDLYAEYVRKNIFQPLNLAATEMNFGLSGSAPQAKGYCAKYSFMNLVKGLVTDRSVWGEYEGKLLHIKDVSVNGPAFGGAIGTARGFSVILQDLLSARSVLLKETGKELLFLRQRLGSGKEIDMTLGWHIGFRDNKPYYYYKEGGGAGYHSEMRMYPSHGLASVIMTNRTSFNSRRMLSKLDDMFLSNSFCRSSSAVPVSNCYEMRQ